MPLRLNYYANNLLPKNQQERTFRSYAQASAKNLVKFKAGSIGDIIRRELTNMFTNSGVNQVIVSNIQYINQLANIIYT